MSNECEDEKRGLSPIAMRNAGKRVSPIIVLIALFEFAALPVASANAISENSKSESAWVAPAPHWLSNDRKQLDEVIKILKLKAKITDIHTSYGARDYVEKGPLGIPALTIDAPAFEYSQKFKYKNVHGLNQATNSCFLLDLIAGKAGAWGSECKVKRILEYPKRGVLTRCKDGVPEGLREGDCLYTVQKLGKDRVRFILENGAGKEVDVTIIFRNIKWVPEEGAMNQNQRGQRQLAFEENAKNL